MVSPGSSPDPGPDLYISSLALDFVHFLSPGPVWIRTLSNKSRSGYESESEFYPLRVQSGF